MPLINLPEKLKPRDVLQNLEQEVSALKEQMTERERALVEMGAMANETKEAEERLAGNRKQTFLLFVEKLRNSEILGVEEFCFSTKVEIERIEARQNKGAAKK